MSLGSTSVVGMTRDQLRSLMLTSMMGRRAGMDPRNFEVGEEDTRLPIQNLGTTAPANVAINGSTLVANNILPNGFTNFSATSGSSCVYTFTDAVTGVYKTLTQISTTTQGFAVQFGVNANIVTTAGSSFNQIIFQGVGHTVCLACVSTSTSAGPIWICSSPASPGLTISTY